MVGRGTHVLWMESKQKSLIMKVTNMSRAIDIKIDLVTLTVNIYPACKRSHASSEMLKMR